MYILVRKFQFSTLCPMPTPSVGVPTLWRQQFAKYYDHLFFRSGGKIFQIVQRNKFSCWGKATFFNRTPVQKESLSVNMKICSSELSEKLICMHDALSEETNETPRRLIMLRYNESQWEKILILISKDFCLPTSCLPKMTVTGLVSSPQTMVHTVFDSIW